MGFRIISQGQGRMERGPDARARVRVSERHARVILPPLS